MKQIMLLVKSTVEEFVKNKKTPCIKNFYCICDDIEFTGIHLTDTIFYEQNKYGLYISLYKENKLRARSGVIFPSKKDLAQEAVFQSIAVCSKCVQYKILEVSELKNLEYRIDLIYSPKKILSVDNPLYDEKTDTLYIQKNYRSALILPDECKDKKEAFYTALKNADINKDEDAEIYCFKTDTIF